MICLGLFGLAAPPPAAAQQIVALVNGQAITSFEVATRIRLISMLEKRQISREAAIEQLIEERIKNSVAKRYGMTASDTDVNTSFTQLAAKNGMSPTQFEEALRGAGLDPTMFKARMRAEYSWATYVRARFRSQTTVSEDAVSDLIAKKEKAGEISTKSSEYKIMQVTFIVPKGSAPEAYARRRGEASAARARFKNCEEGTAFLRALKDVAVKDLVTRTTNQLSKPLVAILERMEVGSLSEPSLTREGADMVALCARREIKEDQALRRQFQEILLTDALEAKSKEHLKEWRSKAVVEIRG